MNIPNTFSAINNMNIRRDMHAAKDSMHSGDVLTKNHKSYTVPGETKDGELGFGSKTQSQNKSYPMDGQNWQINMKNNKHNTLTVENNYGLKNSHYVIEGDKDKDKVELGGKGWKETDANYTDNTTGKTGARYQDGHGNEVLVVNGTKVDYLG